MYQNKYSRPLVTVLSITGMLDVDCPLHLHKFNTNVTKLITQWVMKFLKRASNSETVVIMTGEQVNRGVGYGLELPYGFKFKGGTVSCAWLEEKLKRKILM